MTTEQRLERLERENRWMRRFGAVGISVAAAVFLIGQGKEKKLQDLEVRSLTVKDADGKVRARLGTLAKRASACLALVGKEGNIRAQFWVTAGGSTGLSFWGKDGKGRVLLGTMGDDSPGLVFRDKDANVIWQAPR